MKTRPPIYTRYYDLLGWLLDHTAKFPKNMRFGLVQKIEQQALTLLEQIVEALYRSDRGGSGQTLNDEWTAKMRSGQKDGG
jgi:hypothetical protein